MESGSVPELIQQRRTRTNERVTELSDWLTAAEAEALIGSAACVYATGSVGRGEASEHSGLDVFVVSTRELKRLDRIRLLAKLIDATGAVKFPPFSGDGEYLQVHKVSELIRLLGTRHDDYTNVLQRVCFCCLRAANSWIAVYECALRRRRGLIAGCSSTTSGLVPFAARLGPLEKPLNFLSHAFVVSCLAFPDHEGAPLCAT